MSEVQQKVKHYWNLFKKVNEKDNSVRYACMRPYGLGVYTESVNAAGYNQREYEHEYRMNVVAKSQTEVQLTVDHCVDKEIKHTITLIKEKLENNDGEEYFAWNIQKGQDDKRRPVEIGEFAYWISMTKFTPKDPDPTKTYPDFKLVFTEAENSGGGNIPGGVEISDDDGVEDSKDFDLASALES